MTDQEREQKKEHLSDSEIRALEALPREKLPPTKLEDKVVAELRRRGVIHQDSVSRRLRVLRYVSVAAAAVLIFALGVEVGLRRAAPDDEAQSSAGRQFMLLLFETPGVFQSLPPERAKERVNEYANWARSVAISGVNISGEKLKEDGRALFAGDEGMQINSIPATTEGRLLGGYFAIVAANMEQALEISSTCPHLKYGGEIELREVDLVTESNTD